MTSEVIPLPSLREFEADLTRPCDARTCDEPATWAYWATHTRRGCPGASLLCGRHKDRVLSQWPAFLSGGRQCAVCGQGKAGNVSDHVRLIPL